MLGHTASRACQALWSSRRWRTANMKSTLQMKPLALQWTRHTQSLTQTRQRLYESCKTSLFCYDRVSVDPKQRAVVLKRAPFERTIEHFRPAYNALGHTCTASSHAMRRAASTAGRFVREQVCPTKLCPGFFRATSVLDTRSPASSRSFRSGTRAARLTSRRPLRRNWLPK